MINFLSALLFAIDVICAVLLIGIILIQQSKSGGGLGALGGGMTESVFGAAAGNVITKTTVVLASVFLVSTLLLAFLSKYEPRAETMSERLRQKEQGGPRTNELQGIEEEMPGEDPESVESKVGSDAQEPVREEDEPLTPAVDAPEEKSTEQ